MKKQAIAGAVLGLLGNMAVAQGTAPASGVTIYGLVDAGLMYASSPPPGKEVSKMQMGASANGPRLGFRGTEDLGGGLSALFTLEAGFDVTNGAPSDSDRLFNRQAFAGLKGGFGTVTLGRQYSPYEDVVGTLDPFGNGLMHGIITNVFGKDYLGRVDNAVRYETPSFGGLTVGAMYGMGEVAGSTSKKSFAGGQLNYSGNGLYVGLAYQQRKSNTDPVTTDKHLVFGATYDFGAAKLHGAYGQTKLPGITEEFKSNDFMVGVTVPFGSHTIMGSVTMAKGDNEYKGQNIGLAYTYDFSKRTTFYVSGSKVSNKGSASFVTTGGGTTGAAVGVRHRF